jgi:hypothetical protein
MLLMQKMPSIDTAAGLPMQPLGCRLSGLLIGNPGEEVLLKHHLRIVRTYPPGPGSLARLGPGVPIRPVPLLRLWIPPEDLDSDRVGWA